MKTSLASLLFVLFAVSMFALVLFLRRKQDETRDGFYVANRKVGVLPGALSVAVSWVWAPALFVASAIAYELGLAGALWFIVPNIACFFVFAPIAIRMRKTAPDGYTLPGYFQRRFPKDNKLIFAFSITAVLFMLTAVIENLVAISKLYAFYTGNAGWIAIIVMTAITVGYSVISGLKASVITDVLQMLMVVAIGFILIPWAFSSSSGAVASDAGASIINGIGGKVSWAAIAFAPGLSLLFGLIGGPLGDQMFFQRAMAVRQKDIKKTMYLAGLFFALVPITLSLFGFLGVALGGNIVVDDYELVGAVIVQKFLPMGATVLFFILMMSGLASTLDSAFCGAGAIGGRLFKKKIAKDIGEKTEITISRIVMIVAAVVGALLASISRDIWFVFMTDAAIASAGIVPIVLSVFWKRQTAAASFVSLVLGAGAGVVVSLLGHFADLKAVAALGAPIAVVLGLIASVIISLSVKPNAGSGEAAAGEAESGEAG